MRELLQMVARLAHAAVAGRGAGVDPVEDVHLAVADRLVELAAEGGQVVGQCPGQPFTAQR